MKARQSKHQRGANAGLRQVNVTAQEKMLMVNKIHSTNISCTWRTKEQNCLIIHSSNVRNYTYILLC
jgi:hypothetical protein